MRIAQRLAELGITLPAPQAPVANYVPYRWMEFPDYITPRNWFTGFSERKLDSSHCLLFTSGMIPLAGGTPLASGKLGAEVSVEQGQNCARQCVLNGLAWTLAATSGDLDRVDSVLQVRGFVACTPDFYDHPKVLNGASDLLVEIFGEAGKHTRAAVGVPSLPLNVPVEIDFLFAIR